MKKLAVILSIAVVAMLYNSCGKDFLYEENTAAYTMQHFETEEGVIGLAAALYGNLRGHFNREAAYAYHLSGTDEFVNGADNVNHGWNSYGAGFGPIAAWAGTNTNTAPIAELWDEMYTGIANANLIIANAEVVSNEEMRSKVLGEAYFIRGFNHYHLFAQWGSVPVIRERRVGVQRYFTRASEEETLSAVIEDLQQAYDLLPADRWRGMGTITKYAAAHFLAKALLFRASERCEPWGAATKTADLAKCITLCEEVITAHPLESEYNNLYGHYDKVDADIEFSNEVILSAQFNANGNGRFRNYTNMYHVPQFNTFASGYVARSQGNGAIPRDFQRCCPTEYNYSTYDNVNDARLWKSFRTVYGINNTSSQTQAMNTAYGAQKADLGDYGVIFILNNKNDHRFDSEQFGRAIAGGSTFIHPETNKWVPVAVPLYQNGSYVMRTFSANQARPNTYCGISKMLDGSQLQDNDQGGCRDGVIARSGETYLVKAEAQVRQSQYADAITTVNALRARAQWKAGEDRELYVDGWLALKNNPNFSGNANAMTGLGRCNPGYPITGNDGKTYLTKSTYILSTGYTRPADPNDYPASDLTTGISPSSLPAEDEAILTELGVSGDYDRMLHFILNERTRELNGEWNRWEELSRTKTLVKRTKLYNHQAAPNIQDYHNLRPIPQSFIDGLLNEDNTNLNDAQKKALQNPGY